jgi:hypothetical protein
MRGVTNHDRIDEELYQDYETEEAKQAGAKLGHVGDGWALEPWMPGHLAWDGPHCVQGCISMESLGAPASGCQTSVCVHPSRQNVVSC